MVLGGRDSAQVMKRDVRREGGMPLNGADCWDQIVAGEMYADRSLSFVDFLDGFREDVEPEIVWVVGCPTVMIVLVTPVGADGSGRRVLFVRFTATATATLECVGFWVREAGRELCVDTTASFREDVGLGVVSGAGTFCTPTRIFGMAARSEVTIGWRRGLGFGGECTGGDDIREAR